MSELRIALTPSGGLELRVGTSTIALTSIEDLGPMVLRVLVMMEREKRRGEALSGAGSRFYLMHLERHGKTPQENCQWCREEALAEEVLRHPVTQVPLSARSLHQATIGEALAEELGL